MEIWIVRNYFGEILDYGLPSQVDISKYEKGSYWIDIISDY